MTQEARRVTIWHEADRGWLFKVQGGNWHMIYKTPAGFATQAAAVRRAERKYPDAEIVVEVPE